MMREERGSRKIELCMQRKRTLFSTSSSSAPELTLLPSTGFGTFGSEEEEEEENGEEVTSFFRFDKAMRRQSTARHGVFEQSVGRLELEFAVANR